MNVTDSLTDVGNYALGLLGIPPVQNIDSDTDPAPIVSLHMAKSIRRVQVYPWPELLVRFQPDPLDTPTSDGRYQYNLPTGCLRIVSASAAYDQEGEYVLSAATALEIVYVAENFTPTDWSVELTECVVHQLAADLALPLGKTASMRGRLLEELHKMVQPWARAERSKSAHSTRYRARGFSYARTHMGLRPARER